MAVTIGWLLSITSMGLVDWREWNITHNTTLFSTVVHVGMWEVCIRDIFKSAVCHYYTRSDTRLPLSICASRSLLLMAFAMGFFGKVTLGLAIGNRPSRHAPCTLFTTAGILYLSACFCVSVSVMWCYNCVQINEGVAFAPALHLPFQPDSQHTGLAFQMATVTAVLLLFGSLCLLCNKAPQISPEVAEL
ncbi:claudin-34-like [Rhynchocyon petersi]